MCTGCCMACALSRSLRSRSFTTSPLRKRQSIAMFSRPVAASRRNHVTWRASDAQFIDGIVRSSRPLGDAYRAERVDVREEAAEEVIDPPHAIDERRRTGLVELHVHDVTFGGRDHDALDPRFARVRADIRGDGLHARATER